MPLHARPAGSPARPRPVRPGSGCSRRSTTACGRCQSRSRQRASALSARRAAGRAWRRGRARRRAACAPAPAGATSASAASWARRRGARGRAAGCWKTGAGSLHRCPSSCRRGTPRTPSCMKPVTIRRKRLLYQSRYRGRLGERPAARRLRRSPPRALSRRAARPLRGAARRRAIRTCSPGSPASSRCRSATITTCSACCKICARSNACA